MKFDYAEVLLKMCLFLFICIAKDNRLCDNYL